MKIYNLCNEQDYNYICNLDGKQSLYLEDFSFFQEEYKYYYVNEHGYKHCLIGPAYESLKISMEFSQYNYEYFIEGKKILKKDFFCRLDVIEAIKMAEYLKEHPELEGFI